MNLETFMHLLAIYTAKYAPEQLDPSLKPRDSAGDVNARNIKYDFIIIGAGTEGCVLANRLTENGKWKVLLIEAGGDEDYITDFPAVALRIPGEKYFWNFTTVPQEYVCKDEQGICPFYQGHVMGGSSTTTALVYTRGNKVDFDNWLKLGNSGWGFEDVLQYYKKCENMLIPEFAADTVYHSTEGPVTIDYSIYNNSIAGAYYNAVNEIGLHPTDYNGAVQLGYNYAQLRIQGAKRCSASKAYLDPIRDRKNLYIFKNTMVTKILIDKHTRTAIGVTCVTNGEEYNVYTCKEVIVSAGVINTPKLLMLSGIGPRGHLEELNIPVIADLSGVGENLIDQPGLRLDYRANLEELQYNDKQLKQAIIDYVKHEKGVLTSPPIQVVAFPNTVEPLATDAVPDVMYLDAYTFPPVMSFPNQENNYPILFNIMTLIDPKSKGTVRLQSSNYMDQPLIDPRYYTAEEDRSIAAIQLENDIRFYNLSALSKYQPEIIIPEECMSIDLNNNMEMLECLIKYRTSNGWRGCCTCRMGPSKDKTAVVDAKLKVHSIKNLRVVDASIYPNQVRPNTVATELMIGEKASDLIRNCYK